MTVAAGHGSGADVYDSGVGSAKPETCKAWRNSGQVKLYLCPVRGWQRAGTVPATAARPSPAAASHGRMLALTLLRATHGVS